MIMRREVRNEEFGVVKFHSRQPGSCMYILVAVLTY